MTVASRTSSAYTCNVIASASGASAAKNTTAGRPGGGADRAMAAMSLRMIFMTSVSSRAKSNDEAGDLMSLRESRPAGCRGLRAASALLPQACTW